MPALLLVISLALVAPFVSGCGGASINVDLNTIAAIGSPATSVRVNQTLQLTSSYLASGQAMTFYVNGIPGGNATVGTISMRDSTPPPPLFPTPYSVQITSSIAKYPAAIPGSVSGPDLESDSRPRQRSLQTDSPRASTTVTVNGSQFVYGAQISWNGALVPTTFVSPPSWWRRSQRQTPAFFRSPSPIPIPARPPPRHFL